MGEARASDLQTGQGGNMKLLTATFAAIVLSMTGAAQGQGAPWPSAPIRLIAPYAAGGAVDIVSRLVADKLADRLGTPVVVDNRPGAGSIVGTEILARAAPDGYTIMMANIAHSANPALHKRKLAYDPVKDFEPVVEVVELATVLVVNPAVHARTAAELVALAKAQPGKLNYASAGFGSVNHLAAELFKSASGTDIVHVPYQGGGPSLAALVGGQVDLEFITLPPTLPFIQSGKVRALAVTSAQRHPALPDVPTLAESALPGFQITEWYGILAPARTPKDVVARLNAAINDVLQMPDVKTRIGQMGAQVAGGPPERLARRIQSDLERWARTIKPEMRVD
jgi:tripartite-type tricarboxylate transporter receptor subunit TctC